MMNSQENALEQGQLVNEQAAAEAAAEVQNVAEEAAEEVVEAVAEEAPVAEEPVAEEAPAVEDTSRTKLVAYILVTRYVFQADIKNYMIICGSKFCNCSNVTQYKEL